MEFLATQQCIHSLMNIAKQAISIIHQPMHQQNHPPCCFLFLELKNKLSVRTLTSFKHGLGFNNLGFN
jgi:hypothetical protein